MLVKNVLDIYIRVGMETMDKYENDFEKDLLVATAAYYKRKVTRTMPAWRVVDAMPSVVPVRFAGSWNGSINLRQRQQQQPHASDYSVFVNLPQHVLRPSNSSTCRTVIVTMTLGF